MKEITINIEACSCQHCVMRVKKAIEGLLVFQAFLLRLEALK